LYQIPLRSSFAVALHSRQNSGPPAPPVAIGPSLLLRATPPPHSLPWGAWPFFTQDRSFAMLASPRVFFFFLPPCAVRYATYVRRDWQNLMCHRTARRAAMGRSTPVRRLRSPSQRPAPCIQWLDARGNTAVMVMIAAEIYKLYTHVATPAGQYLTCVV